MKISTPLQDTITPEIKTKNSISKNQADNLVKKYANKVSGNFAEYKMLSVSDINNLEGNRSVNAGWCSKVLGIEKGLNKTYIGAIDVALVDGEYYCWNGNGRLTLATITKLDKIPCLITKMDSVREANDAYNKVQSTLVRTQHPNNLFINAVIGGNDVQVKQELSILNYVGLKVVDLTDRTNYVPDEENTAEQDNFFVTDYSQFGNINISAFRKILKISELSLNLANWSNPSNLPKVDHIRNAVKIIRDKWPDEEDISKELLGGVIMLYRTYPALLSGNGAQKTFEAYLDYVAQGKTQKKLTFKHDGGNQHNKEELSVAIGILKGLFEWKKTPQRVKNECPKHRLNDLLPQNQND